MLDFSDWEIAKEFSSASGASQKEWLINPEKSQVGLFKFPKSSETFEHFSEKIASELAQIIGIECAKIDVGKYHGRLGSISYLINDKSKDSLIEGVTLIAVNRANYNPYKLKDMDLCEYYNLDMILESIRPYNLETVFLKILIFDYIIGNSDRHHSNWAVLDSGKLIKMCPIYDNGSSLCCYIKEDDIKSKRNDIQWFDSILVSKSKSIVRLYKNKKSKPTHKEIMEYLKSNYYKETIQFVKNIKEKLGENVISDLIERCSYGILTEERKSLLKRYLVKKVEDLVCIYDSI